MNDKTLIVKKKNVYGNELIYPVCQDAIIFSCIAGTKTYTFKTKEEAKFFMMGVDEANGWLEYEVVSGWFDK